MSLLPPRNGRPSFYLDLRDPSGRRHIRSLRTADPAQAQARYFALAARLTSETDSRPDPSILSVLRDRVIRHIEISLSPSTARNYRAALDSFLKHIGDTRKVNSVTRRDVDEWRAWIAGDGHMAHSSVNLYAQTLRAAWNLAVSWNLASTNPFARLKRLRVDDDGQGRYFSPDDLRRIMAALSGLRRGWLHAGAAQVALYTGLRVGEIVQLRPEHIEGDRLRVVGQTKTGRSRLVPIAATARPILSGLARRGGAWLFPSQKHPGGHVGAGALEQMFMWTCRKIGISGHYHMLRHTFAARHLSAGVPLKTVSVWLGHTTTATTDRHYGHLIPGSQDHLIDAASDPLQA